MLASLPLSSSSRPYTTIPTTTGLDFDGEFHDDGTGCLLIGGECDASPRNFRDADRLIQHPIYLELLARFLYYKLFLRRTRGCSLSFILLFYPRRSPIEFFLKKKLFPLSQWYLIRQVFRFSKISQGSLQGGLQCRFRFFFLRQTSSFHFIPLFLPCKIS